MKNALLFLLLLFMTHLHSQEFDRVKMDQFLDALAKNDRAMGSLSIYQDGKRVYEKSIGYLDVDQKKPANSQSKYRIGSISKTFTAIVMMQMIDEQRLALDMPLNKFFPGVPNADKITIEQLLQHRSGLFNFTDKEDYPTWMEQAQTQTMLLKRIVENGTDFEPGAATAYSNTNFLLLSWIAEKVDQKDFAQIIDERIVQKCGLKNTFVGGKIDTSDNQAHSYFKTANWIKSPETDMSIPLGAGAIVSTPSDLNEMLIHLFGGQLVSKTALEKMSTMIEGLGMGLFEVPFYERKAIGHNGRIDGFESTAIHFKADNTTLSYLSNGLAYPFNDILIGILSIYFGKDYTIPAFNSTLKVNSEDLDRYVGTYASKGLPLKITISKKEGQLIAQASGQSAFPLEAFEPHKFRFDAAGIILKFEPAEQQMTLFQGGGTFIFKME
ncbi:MAG: serine hydrolase [Bacteroidota bacterium]